MAINTTNMSLSQRLIELYENAIVGTDHQTVRTALPNGAFLVYVSANFGEEGMGELLQHSLEMATEIEQRKKEG